MFGFISENFWKVFSRTIVLGSSFRCAPLCAPLFNVAQPDTMDGICNGRLPRRGTGINSNWDLGKENFISPNDPTEPKNKFIIKPIALNISLSLGLKLRPILVRFRGIWTLQIRKWIFIIQIALSDRDNPFSRNYNEDSPAKSLCSLQILAFSN